jgi:hypothetical protein
MKYSPVGACIYCGSTEGKLGEEHIIPFSLNGALVLPLASCKKCEKETHTYEFTVARRIFGHFRIRYGVQTRRKKKRPKFIEIGTIDELGRRGSAQIPYAECPVTLILYKFEECEYLKGNSEHQSKFNWVPITIFSKAELDKLIEEYGWDRTVQFKTVPNEFARMIGKIAYSFMVAELGLSGFTPHKQLIDVILNRSDNISYLIGGDWDIPPADPSGHHHLQWIADVKEGYADVIVELRLFPAFETPVYRVVVGKISLSDPVQKKLLDKKIQRGLNDGTASIEIL